jgi:hypothetical protein
MHTDLAFGLIALAVAVAYYLMAAAIPETVLGDAVGAAGLPKLYAYILGALALVLIARSSRQRAAGSGEGNSDQLSALSDQEEGTEAARRSGQPWLRAAGIVLLGVAYILIVPWAGYMPALAVLIGATAYYEGVRDRRVVIVAIVGAAFFWVLFVRFLGIAQPSGLWPSFD